MGRGQGVRKPRWQGTQRGDEGAVEARWKSAGKQGYPGTRGRLRASKARGGQGAQRLVSPHERARRPVCTEPAARPEKTEASPGAAARWRLEGASEQGAFENQPPPSSSSSRPRPQAGTPSSPLPDKACLVSPTLCPPLGPQGTWAAASRERSEAPDRITPHAQPIQLPQSRKQQFNLKAILCVSEREGKGTSERRAAGQKSCSPSRPSLQADHPPSIFRPGSCVHQATLCVPRSGGGL